MVSPFLKIEYETRRRLQGEISYLSFTDVLVHLAAKDNPLVTEELEKRFLQNGMTKKIV